MANQKARKTKARGGVRNLSAKTVGVREARTVKGGDTKSPTKPTTTTKTKTTSTDNFLEFKLESPLITS